MSFGNNNMLHVASPNLEHSRHGSGLLQKLGSVEIAPTWTILDLATHPTHRLQLDSASRSPTNSHPRTCLQYPRTLTTDNCHPSWERALAEHCDCARTVQALQTYSRTDLRLITSRVRHHLSRIHLRSGVSGSFAPIWHPFRTPSDSSRDNPSISGRDMKRGGSFAPNPGSNPVGNDIPARVPNKTLELLLVLSRDLTAQQVLVTEARALHSQSPNGGSHPLSPYAKHPLQTLKHKYFTLLTAPHIDHTAFNRV
ncbi:hypothetical protein DFH09DRAFT_1080716 [Mycena vulgaris]|nr:hypothetical protein DFH09DRAFT_1080716 [Mycena vulgaris]